MTDTPIFNALANNGTPEPRIYARSGVNAAKRMLRRTSDNQSMSQAVADNVVRNQIAKQRAIANHSVELPHWPEMSAYGSLSFHVHISQLVDLWNDFPIIGNPTARIDFVAECSGTTVVRFESHDESGRFVSHNGLYDAVIAEGFESEGATDINAGHIQFRNNYPKEYIDQFLSTVIQGQHDLRIAVNRISEMMKSSRTAMLAMTKETKR